MFHVAINTRRFIFSFSIFHFDNLVMALEPPPSSLDAYNISTISFKSARISVA